jgi:hypothetical protein
LLPTYTSIRKLIFEPKCLSCHAPGERADEVPLHTLQDLLMVEGLINLQNPEQSDLITAVTRTRRPMPPPRTGLSPLTSDEVAVLIEWIRQGTPQ